MKIPRILKHMTIAIFYGGTIGPTDRATFKRAFLIAQGQLKNHGFLVGSGEEFALTAKGHKREREFHNEGIKGWVKDRQFDWHYLWVKQKDVEAEKEKYEQQKKEEEARKAEEAQRREAQKAQQPGPMLGRPVPGAPREEVLETQRLEDEALLKRTKK